MDTTELSDDDVALRSAVADYAARELAPRAGELDRSGRFPDDAVRELGRLGLFGLAIPERFGGQSGTRVQLSLVIEELARADAATALTLMSHLHSTGVIARFGDEDQCARWLPGAATGQRLVAVCLTEPDAGTDIASMRATARRDGGDYVLDARKTFITSGDHADVFVVFARAAGVGEGNDRALSAFVVDAHAPGVAASRPFHKLGLRSSSTTEVVLDGVRVPAADRLGADGDGLSFALQSLDGARMSTAAQGVGIAQGAFDIAFEYAQRRVQSGKPIAGHQAVQLRLADLHIGIAAARSLLYAAARRIDANGGTGPIDAATAKVFCTQTASAVSSRAVELVGGYGYMEESRLPRYLRDAKGGEIYDGTNDVNRLLIARQLLRNG